MAGPEPAWFSTLSCLRALDYCFSHVKHLNPLISTNPNPILSSRFLLGVRFPPFSHQGKCWDWKVCLSPSSYSPFLMGEGGGNLVRTWHLLSLSQVCWWESNWARKQDSGSTHLLSFPPSLQVQGLSPFSVTAGSFAFWPQAVSTPRGGAKAHGRWSYYRDWDNNIQHLIFKCTHLSKTR